MINGIGAPNNTPLLQPSSYFSQQQGSNNYQGNTSSSYHPNNMSLGFGISNDSISQSGKFKRMIAGSKNFTQSGKIQRHSRQNTNGRGNSSGSGSGLHYRAPYFPIQISQMNFEQEKFSEQIVEQGNNQGATPQQQNKHCRQDVIDEVTGFTDFELDSAQQLKTPQQLNSNYQKGSILSQSKPNTIIKMQNKSGDSSHQQQNSVYSQNLSSQHQHPNMYHHHHHQGSSLHSNNQNSSNHQRYNSDGNSSHIANSSINSYILNKSPMLVPLKGSKDQHEHLYDNEFQRQSITGGYLQSEHFYQNQNEFHQYQQQQSSSNYHLSHQSAILGQNSQIQNSNNKAQRMHRSAKVRKISNLPTQSSLGPGASNMSNNFRTSSQFDQTFQEAIQESPRNSIQSQQHKNHQETPINSARAIGQKKNIFSFSTNNKQLFQSSFLQNCNNFQPPNFVTQSYDSATNHFSKPIFSPCGNLRSHFDGVRDIQFLKSKSGKEVKMATVSEDCQIRIWNLQDLFQNDGKAKNESRQFPQIQPKLTCRAHTGPLFAVTSFAVDTGNLLYTGGLQGIIRIWHIPKTLPPFYNTTNGINHCVGVWTSHKDVIWELHHHPRDNQIVSVSSDATVKLWQDFNLEDIHEPLDENSNKCLLGSFINRYTNPNYIEIPTSATWVPYNDNTLLISYITPVIGIFDRGGRNKGNLTFESQNNLHFTFQQVNKILAHSHFPLLLSAHENNCIRFFDLKSNQQIKKLIAHTQAVTSLEIGKNPHHIISGSHDGSLRIWDIRNYQCIAETQVNIHQSLMKFNRQAHRKKFDESIYTVAMHDQLSVVASGGADGIVKIFQLNESTTI